MKKGKRLSTGDTIGIVAPSSPAKRGEVEKAKSDLEALGFNVYLGKTCFKKHGGYLAGTIEQRVNELHDMFVDETIDGIICLRGGYGTPQLLNEIDFELIKNNPKVFVGYSDITALHISFQQRANLCTVHGPMASRGLNSLREQSKKYLFRTIMENKPLGQIENPQEEPIKTLVPGIAQGKIIGGNLTLIASTMGTPYEIDTQGKLLFIEDVGEEPYRIDRMLHQLALAGKFSDAAGVIIGTWSGCEPNKYDGCFTVEQLFEQIIKPFNKPTIYNVQSGHDDWNMTLPFGVDTTLDATKGIIQVNESVVL
ncbi:MAG TPA: LD-carboxypeptidase [Bacillota bacterium]|nr:LD-carboxypeptidase [Bacillota bacterium]